MLSSHAKQKKPTLLLVDGNWFLHRAFNVTGLRRDAARAINNLMLTLICKDAVRLGASHVAVCFDGPAVFRYSIFPKYKDKRKTHKGSGGDGGLGEVEDGPYLYLTSVLEMLASVGIFAIQRREFESDDLMAGLAHRFADECSLIYVDSHDKDLMQTVRANVYVYYPPNNADESPKVFRPNDVKRVWGVLPEQLVGMQTLIGDAIDGIPSIARCSKDKAKKILSKYGSLNAYLKSKEGRPFWIENRQEIVRNHKLVKLEVDSIPSKIKLEHLRVRKISDEAFRVKRTNLRVPPVYYQLRELAHPRTKSLFG
jgi:DNA polymerase-1